MKFLDEYRDADAAKRFAGGIRQAVTRHWTIMEVCGGQTHAIVKFGIDELLPAEVELVHGTVASRKTATQSWALRISFRSVACSNAS